MCLQSQAQVKLYSIIKLHRMPWKCQSQLSVMSGEKSRAHLLCDRKSHQAPVQFAQGDTGSHRFLSSSEKGAFLTFHGDCLGKFAKQFLPHHGLNPSPSQGTGTCWQCITQDSILLLTLLLQISTI